MSFDSTYLSLVNRVLKYGRTRETRAKLQSTGEHISAVTLFGHEGGMGLSLVVPDIHEQFPLLTTKHVSFHNIKEELLWFLRGETNVRSLQAKKVHIWDEWADENGELGEVYGAQWRNWNGNVDQIALIKQGIAAVLANPTASVGRRLILTAWNVDRVPNMTLPPCHTLAQWDVDAERQQLHCAMYMRSCDAFLGLPYNVAQYALLTQLLAHYTPLTAGSLTVSFGNLHVYTNHIEQIQQQSMRTIFPSPRVRIVEPIDPMLCVVPSSAIELSHYQSHPPIRGEVAV